MQDDFSLNFFFISFAAAKRFLLTAEPLAKFWPDSPLLQLHI